MLTRLASTEGEGPVGSGGRSRVGPVDEPSAVAAAGSTGATPGTLWLTDSPFVYLGQPYVVAPDGRVFQPWGNEGGYSILVHSFAEVEEVQP